MNSKLLAGWSNINRGESELPYLTFVIQNEYLSISEIYSSSDLTVQYTYNGVVYEKNINAGYSSLFLPSIDILSPVTIFGSLLKINLKFSSVISIDALKCRTISELSCDFNSLEYLDVTNLRKLERLICISNSIKSLTLKNASKLNLLYCNTNQLESLDVSNLKNLVYLSVGNNPFLSDPIESLKFSASLNDVVAEKFLYINGSQKEDIKSVAESKGWTVLFDPE